MGKPQQVYIRSSGLTPEQARDLRARAWSYVFDCYRKNKAGASSTVNYGKEIKDVPANPILLRQR